MADFTALKTAIQTYIKQNGNEEITGNILQEVLLAMVQTMGDGAINDLVTALSNEVTNRQNADGTLQNNINAEALARGNADTALGGRLTTVEGAITAINTKLSEGYVYAGIATPSTNPGSISGKVFYIAVQAGTYTNFGGTAVTEGITILKYNGTSWVKEQALFSDGGVFDISAYNNDTYDDLSDALSGTNVPTNVRKGGMSVKFVQSSDNTYVQYRLMNKNWSTIVSDWQGVDEEPTAGSDNLVKSGGVADALSPLVPFTTLSVARTSGIYIPYKAVEGGTYKVKNNIAEQIVVVTRATIGGSNIDRVEISANSEATFTASGDASYFYVYTTTTGTIDVYSMSTGENLLDSIKDKVFTGTYSSGNIEQKTTAGLYKNETKGTMLLVRVDGAKVYQNELINDITKKCLRVRSRVKDGSWGDWVSFYTIPSSETVQIFHQGIAPNYDTVNDCIVFSSYTSFILTNARYKVNDFAAFANDKLEVSLSDLTAFKLLLDKQTPAVVAVSITDNSYDAQRYALILTGRKATTTEPYTFSIPVTVDGVDYVTKANELYDNTYGYSDDVNIAEPGNYDIIWTYWDYPQAIVTSKSKKLMFGFTDSVGRIGICTYDPDSKNFIRNILRKTNAVDDHNACIVTEDSDGKLIYLSDGKHGGENIMHNRITNVKTTYEGDIIISQNISALGRDKIIPIGGQCVYTQALKVNGVWYVFTRKNATSWVYVSTSDFVTWTSPKVVVFDPDDVQLYCLFRPVIGESSLLRIAMYNNATTENTEIRLGYLDLSNDKIYGGDHSTELGTAGVGVSKADFTTIVAQETGSKNRLFDLAVADINNVVVSYCKMTDGYSVAQYRIYRNGSVINTVVSTNPFLLSAFGGQMFVGDNPDKLVANYFDDTNATEEISGHDITKIMNYSNGSYIAGQVLNSHEVTTASPYIREIRPRTDKDGKYVITHKGYYNSDNYHDFLTDACVYEIQ